MKIVQQHYHADIEANARQYGYKAANLLFLNSILAPFAEFVSVPLFSAISDAEIKQFLNRYVPESWQLWLAFRKQYQKKGMDKAAVSLLAELRDCIENAFQQHAFELNLPEELRVNTKFIVRSTGPEDSAVVANPGGNASYPSSLEKLSATIGRVLISYFTEKSLQQRFLAGMNITATPSLPVLIQKMVGGGEYTVSGVVYAEQGGTIRINAAFGHGEGVVGGLLPCDEYWINDGVVYSRLASERMKTILDAEGKPVIVPIDSFKLRFASALTEEQAWNLAKVSEAIVLSYGRDMDIEFVLEGEKIFIVQARAITFKKINDEDDDKKAGPTALKPELVAACHAFYGKSITSDYHQAVLLNEPNALFIGQDIRQALGFYLDPAQKMKPLAVAVCEDAPSTSHEAGQFMAMGVPVLAIKSPEKLKDLLRQGKRLVVDNQRKAIFVLPDNISQKEVLAEGYFASTLPAETHVLEIPLRHLDDMDDSFEEIEALDSLGERIHRAKSDKKVRVHLVQELYKAIQTVAPMKRYMEKNTFEEKEEKQPEEAVKEALQTLATVTPENLQGHRLRIRRLMRTMVELRKHEKISVLLTQKAMLAGVHLLSVLGRVEREGLTTSHHRSYLDVYNKFAGLFMAVEGLSLKTDPETVYSRHVLSGKTAVSGGKQGETEEILKLCLRLKTYFLTQGPAWEAFCIAIGKTEGMVHRLGYMVAQVVALNIHEPWCNITCSSVLQEEGKAEAKFSKLWNDFIKLKEMRPVLRTFLTEVQRIKSVGGDCAMGEEKALTGLASGVSALSKMLLQEEGKNTSTLSQFLMASYRNALVETLDLAIKGVLHSSAFNNKITQANYFKKMLVIFYQLLQEWTPIEINQHSKMAIFNYTNHKLQHAVTKEDLALSGHFNVSTANINSKIVGDEGWGRILQKCRTLHDLFTLLHQSLLIVNVVRQQQIQAIIKRQFPEKLRRQCEALEAGRYMGSELGLLSVVQMQGRVEIDYNMQLRNHSAILKLIYKKERIYLKGVAFGYNSGGRWTKAAQLLFFSLSKIEGLSFLKLPAYSKLTHSLEFLVDITGADVAMIAEALDYFLAKPSFSLSQVVVEELILMAFKKILFSETRSKDLSELPIYLLNNKLIDQDKFEKLQRLFQVDVLDDLRYLPLSGKILDFNPNEIKLFRKIAVQHGLDVLNAILDFCINSDSAVETVVEWYNILGEEQFKLLADKAFIPIYRNGLVSLDCLAQYCSQWQLKKFKAIIDSILDPFYKKSMASLDQLSDFYDELGEEKFNLLIRTDCFEICSDGELTIDELSLYCKVWENEKFQVIMSCVTSGYYEKKIASLSQLGSYYDCCGKENFRILTSPAYLRNCSLGRVALNDLSDFCGEWPNQKLRTITSHMADSFFKDCIDSLKSLSTYYDLLGDEKFKLFANNVCFKVYHKGSATLEDLSTCCREWNSEKFTTITHAMLDFYFKKEVASLRQLGAFYDVLGAEKFGVLTSSACFKICQAGFASLTDLSACCEKWPINKFETIMRCPLIYKYKNSLIFLEQLSLYYDTWGQEKLLTIMPGLVKDWLSPKILDRLYEVLGPEQFIQKLEKCHSQKDANLLVSQVLPGKLSSRLSRGKPLAWLNQGLDNINRQEEKVTESLAVKGLPF